MTMYVPLNINDEPATNEVYPPAENPEQQTAPSVEQPPTMQLELRTGKSAVSELHELAVQIGETLSWVQESECGPAHCKLFSMKVTMGTQEATGSGRSKKIAKQVAAQSLLTKINEMSTAQQGEAGQEYGPQLPQGNQTQHHALLGNTETSKVATENPVSKLQHITTKHNLGPPEYQVVNEDGAHALQRFDIKVKVKELESSGLGRSKKTAKRNAAQAMLDQLSKTNACIAPPIKRMTFVPAVNSDKNNGTS